MVNGKKLDEVKETSGENIYSGTGAVNTSAETSARAADSDRTATKNSKSKEEKREVRGAKRQVTRRSEPGQFLKKQKRDTKPQYDPSEKSTSEAAFDNPSTVPQAHVDIAPRPTLLPLPTSTIFPNLSPSKPIDLANKIFSEVYEPRHFQPRIMDAAKSSAAVYAAPLKSLQSLSMFIPTDYSLTTPPFERKKGLEIHELITGPLPPPSLSAQTSNTGTRARPDEVVIEDSEYETIFTTKATLRPIQYQADTSTTPRPSDKTLAPIRDTFSTLAKPPQPDDPGIAPPIQSFQSRHLPPPPPASYVSFPTPPQFAPRPPSFIPQPPYSFDADGNPYPCPYTITGSSLLDYQAAKPSRGLPSKPMGSAGKKYGSVLEYEVAELRHRLAQAQDKERALDKENMILVMKSQRKCS